MESSAPAVTRFSVRRAALPGRAPIARAIAGIAVLAHLLGLAALPAGTWLAHLWSDAFWTVGSLVCAVEHARVARAVESPRGRRAWSLLSLGSASWFLTMLWWSWRELVDGAYVPALELPSVGFAVMPVCFAVGLPFFRAERRDEGPRRAEWLADASIAVLLIGVIWGGLLYEPLRGFGGPHQDLIAPLARAAGYSAALVVGALIFARPVGVRASTASLVLAGLAILTGLYFVFVATLLTREYEVGRALDAFWTAAFALLVLAGVEEGSRVSGRPGGGTAWLPSPMAFVWSIVLGATALGLLLYDDLLHSIPHVSLVVVLVFAIVLAVRSDLMLASERRARREIQAALATRQEFLTIASHELRTPLTPMRIWISGLQRRLGDEGGRGLSGASLTPALAALDRSLLRLERLANRLVEAVRMDEASLPLRLEIADLSELARDVAAGFRASPTSREVDLSVDAEVPVLARCDVALIEQALGELIVNAIRFGPNQPVEVRVRGEPGTAKIAVRDHGIGVGPELRGKLFQKFERGARIDYGGLGLGLFIARTIVGAHGGTIDVESAPGAGSTFTITLPLDARVPSQVP